MNARLLALALVGIGISPAAVAAPPDGSPDTRVYYFHATARCATCKTIEAYARETVETRFTTDLEARRLQWLVVNVDEPANQHFVRDFKLYTRAVVIVDAKNPKRFKVLDRVWRLVHDKAAFQEYVEREIRSFPRS